MASREESFRMIMELDYLSFSVSEALSVVYVVWKRQPGSEELRTGLELVAGQLIAYNVRGWLADFRKVQLMSEADQHWYRYSGDAGSASLSVKTILILILLRHGCVRAQSWPCRTSAA